ncbi:MAG: hypothetical protein ACJ8CR_19700 [Roseiflexaceae bacterium]
MTHPDLLALLEEGIQNGRIAPHLADYIAAEMRGRHMDAMPSDDQEARAALTPADRGGDAS